MNAVSNKACLICISHASYFGTPTELAIALGECKEKAIRLQAEIKLLTDDALKTSAEDDRLEKIRERAEAATPGGELFARLTQECDNCYTPRAQLLRACNYHEGWLDGHGERDPDIPYLLAEVERLTEESNGWKANYLAAVEVGKDWTADRQYAKAEIERLREELDDATGGFLTATPTAIERITSLKAEVERLRAALEGDDFIARCADALHGHRCDQAVGHSLPHRAEFGTDIYRWQPIEDETPEGGEL